MLTILYLILTFSLILFAFSLGRYPFLNPSRNLIFAASGTVSAFSILAFNFLNITLSGYEIFLLSILATVFFRHGRKRRYLHGSLLFKKESSGTSVTVEENVSQNTRVLKRDGKVLSGINLLTGEPSSNVLKYPHLAELFPISPKKIWCLGEAAYAYPSYAFNMKKGLSIDVVEVDPVVMEATKKFFRIPKNRRFRLILADAYSQIQRTRKPKYSLIFVDVGILISKISPPANEKFIDKKTLKFYKKNLSSKGTLTINVITTLHGSDIKLVSNALAPYKKAFKSYLAFIENPESNKNQLQNITHIFSNQKVDINTIRKNLKAMSEDDLSYSKYTFEKLLDTYRPL